MDEIELIKKIKRGNKELFSEIVNKYKRVVYNHAYSFLRNKEEAEDTVQEIFTTIYKNIKSFREEAKLGTWIYRITVNICKNKLKQLKRKNQNIIEEIPEWDEDSEENPIEEKLKDKDERTPDNVLVSDEIKKIVFKRMGELAEEQRKVLILRDIDGLSYEEIAKILKLSVSAVKSKIFRARENLREKLKKDDIL
jgi:RNA polymerase sigma-70 factor (ECF subfamily)